MSRHKSFIGPVERWDIQAAGQFTFMVHHGLRGHHRLLDIGCGSLRAGRLFIPYLDAKGYYGIEPEAWLLEEGINEHVGHELMLLRQPNLIIGDGARKFPCSEFGVKFNYVIAQSVFTHATQAQVKQCLKSVAAVLAPGGMFAATYQHGTIDSDADQWQYPGCVDYSPGFMQRAAAEAGLTCTEEPTTVLGLQFPWAVFRSAE